jgi:hypothetical protein
MAGIVIEVGVLIARRALSGPWAAEAWRPVAVLAAAPALEMNSLVASRDGEETYYAGAHMLELHAAETAHYRDNLASGRPSVWLALRLEDGRPRISSISVDPYEGEAMADAIGDIVEAVPMPPVTARAVADFITQHHVERPFIKRKRNRESGGRA